MFLFSDNLEACSQYRIRLFVVPTWQGSCGGGKPVQRIGAARWRGPQDGAAECVTLAWCWGRGGETNLSLFAAVPDPSAARGGEMLASESTFPQGRERAGWAAKQRVSLCCSARVFCSQRRSNAGPGVNFFPQGGFPTRPGRSWLGHGAACKGNKEGQRRESGTSPQQLEGVTGE